MTVNDALEIALVELELAKKDVYPNDLAEDVYTNAIKVITELKQYDSTMQGENK